MGDGPKQNRIGAVGVKLVLEHIAQAINGILKRAQSLAILSSAERIEEIAAMLRMVQFLLSFFESGGDIVTRTVADDALLHLRWWCQTGERLPA